MRELINLNVFIYSNYEFALLALSTKRTGLPTLSEVLTEPLHSLFSMSPGSSQESHSVLALSVPFLSLNTLLNIWDSWDVSQHAINRPCFASLLHLDDGNSDPENKPCGGTEEQRASAWQWLRLYLDFKGISAGSWLSLGFSTAFGRKCSIRTAARTSLQDSHPESPPLSHTAGGARHIMHSWFVSALDSLP